MLWNFISFEESLYLNYAERLSNANSVCIYS